MADLEPRYMLYLSYCCSIFAHSWKQELKWRYLVSLIVVPMSNSTTESSSKAIMGEVKFHLKRRYEIDICDWWPFSGIYHNKTGWFSTILFPCHQQQCSQRWSKTGHVDVYDYQCNRCSRSSMSRKPKLYTIHWLLSYCFLFFSYLPIIDQEKDSKIDIG